MSWMIENCEGSLWRKTACVFLTVEEDYSMGMEMVRDKAQRTMTFILNLIMGLNIKNQVNREVQTDRTSFVCCLKQNYKQCDNNLGFMTVPATAFWVGANYLFHLYFSLLINKLEKIMCLTYGIFLSIKFYVFIYTLAFLKWPCLPVDL